MTVEPRLRPAPVPGDSRAADESAARAGLTLLCRPGPRCADRRQLSLLLPASTGWGCLLQSAIEHKLVCVLAEALTHEDLAEQIPARTGPFPGPGRGRRAHLPPHLERFDDQAVSPPCQNGQR
ncbi:hypothetical protein ACFQX6_12835 [Streptosporangium lutulentum]